jgi:GDP-mannose 6-dehydrogenase
MGYVGTVSAACLCEKGHTVICVDTDCDKVELLAHGKSPIVEDGVAELVQRAVKNDQLSATTDAFQAVADSELSIVCVGTPSRANGSLNLSYVERVCDEIGSAIAQKEQWHDIVIRSTMLPGSTENVVLPALRRNAGEPGEKYGLCFNPEFLREGSAVYDYANPPKTVIGKVTDRTAKTVAALFEDLPAPLITVDYQVAEAVKYVDNVWHALKVCFANEVGRICHPTGLDSREVMNVFKQDRKLNISDNYLSPGFAFGGSCLPKDVRALAYHARNFDVAVPILESIHSSNRQHIDFGIDLIRRLGHKEIGIFGFAFKAGTDDLRESPMVELIEHLLGKGYRLKIFDRSVNVAFLRGANRRLLMEKIPHIADLMVDSPSDLFEHGKAIVIGNAARELAEIPSEYWAGKDVVDLADALDKQMIPFLASYTGPGWR